MKIAGFVLIVLGVLAMVYQGIRYTTQEKLIHIGSIRVTATEKKKFPLPPIVGALAIAAGVAMVLAERRKR